MHDLHSTGGRYPGSFARRRRYRNELLVIPLPAGVDACDIGILTIWCEPFRAFFTSITLSHEALFVSHSACFQSVKSTRPK